MMSQNKVDVLLVGAGVMSATLGKLLAQLDPSLKIVMVERLAHVAHESSHGLNNAGTGHAGYCELNYTPQQPDGSIRIARALEINADFEVSLQFWSYLVEQGLLPTPEKFINPVFHQSFVWGEERRLPAQRYQRHSTTCSRDGIQRGSRTAQMMLLVMGPRPEAKVAGHR
jgi:malate dehydrogenase (quinone)